MIAFFTPKVNLVVEEEIRNRSQARACIAILSLPDTALTDLTLKANHRQRGPRRKHLLLSFTI